MLDYSLVIASWLDVATSASTYRERVQLASTIRVFRFVRIVRVLDNSKSDLLVIARGRPGSQCETWLTSTSYVASFWLTIEDLSHTPLKVLRNQ